MKMIGTLEVIVGGMFSGKSEELMRRLRLATYAKRRVVAIKPKKDDRYSGTELTSHTGVQFKAVPVHEVTDIYGAVAAGAGGPAVVGIDEGHLFGEETPGLLQVSLDLLTLGHRVIVAGLDVDYQNRAFLTMAVLMAQSDRVDKLAAVCVLCGNPARISFRLPSVASSARLVVGGADAYEPRCRSCAVAGGVACQDGMG